MLVKKSIALFMALVLCTSFPATGLLTQTVRAEEPAQSTGTYTDAPQPGQTHIYAGSTADMVDDWGDPLQGLIPQEKYLNTAASTGSFARMFNFVGYGRAKEQTDFGVSAAGNGWHRKMTQRVAYKNATFTYDIPVDASLPAPLYLSMETMGELKVSVNGEVKIDSGAVGWDGYGITAREIVLTNPQDWASGQVSVTFADADPSTGSEKPWLDAEQKNPNPEFGVGAHLIWLEAGPSSTFRDRAEHILWDAKSLVWNVGYYDGRSTEFKGSGTSVANAAQTTPDGLSPNAATPYEIKWNAAKNAGSRYYLLAGAINGEKGELVVALNGNPEVLRAPASPTKGLGPTTERVHDLDVTSLVQSGANTLSLTLPAGGSLDFAALVEVVDDTITKDQLKMSFGGNELAENWTKLVNSTMYFHNDMMTDKSSGYIVASLPNGLFPQLYFLADAAPAMLETAKWGYADEAKQATLFRTAGNHNGGDNGAAGIVYATIAYLMKGDNYEGDYINKAWPLLQAGLNGLNSSIDSGLKLIKGNNVETTSKEYSIYNNSINAFAFLAGAEAAQKLGHTTEAATWKTAANTLAEGISENLITTEDTAVGEDYTIGKDTWKYGVTASKSTFGGVNAGWFGVGSQEELYYGYKGYSDNPTTGTEESDFLNKWREISANTLDYHAANFWEDWNLYGHNRGFGTSYGVLSERGGWPTSSMLMSDEMGMFTKNLNHIIWNSSDLNFDHGNMGVQETSPWLLIREANRSDHGVGQLSEIGNGGYNEDMNSVEYIVALRNARIMAGLDDSLEGSSNVNIIPRLPLGFNNVTVNGWQANYVKGGKTERTNVSYDYNVSALQASITASAEDAISGSRFRFGPFDVRAELDSATRNSSDVTAQAEVEVRGDSKWVWVDGDITTAGTEIVVNMKLDDLGITGQAATATKLFDEANTAEFDFTTDVNLTSGQAGILFCAAGTGASDDGYRFVLDKNAGEEGQLRLEQTDGTLLHKLDMNVNVGRTYRLRLAKKGATMMAFLDGVKVMHVMDTTHTLGKQGVYVNGSASHENITCVNNADTVEVSPLVSATISFRGGYQDKEVPYMFMGQNKQFRVMATFQNGDTLDISGMSVVEYTFSDAGVLEHTSGGNLAAKQLGTTTVQATVTVGGESVQTNTTPAITVEDFTALYVYTPKPNEKKALETMLGKTNDLTLWTKYSNNDWWILDDEMPELDISFAVDPANVATVAYDYSRTKKSRTQITATGAGEALVQATVTIDGKSVTSPATGGEKFLVNVVDASSFPNFFADFDDGTADGWNGSSTNWSVENGRYKVAVDSGDRWSISTAKGADFAYSADIELEKGTAAGLTFRSNDSGSSSYDVILDKNEGLKLNRRAYTNLEKVPLTIEYKKTYRLKVVVEGNTLKAYVNGELKLTYDELTNYSIGNFGLLAFESTAYFDNLKAYTTNQLEYIQYGTAGQTTIQLEQGSTNTPPLVVKNADETEGDRTALTFASTNPQVATVDATGQITAVGVGETKVTAQIDLGGGVVVSSREITVVVYASETGDKLGPVSLVSDGSTSVAKGDQLDIRLQAFLEDESTPCNLANAVVQWEVLPAGIVSIKSTGNSAITLQGDAPGEVSIKATVTYNGESKTTDPFVLTVAEGEGFLVTFEDPADADAFTRTGPDVWSVADGVMKIAGGSGDYWNLHQESGGDFKFSVDVTMTSGNSAGIGFRKTDSANTGYDLIFSFFDGLKFARRNYHVLDQKANIKPLVGQTYNLAVVAEGSLFKVYVDDVLAMEVTDSTYASGNFALYGFDATVATFDNMKVEPLDKQPPTWGSALLAASDITKNSAVLTWDAAADKSGIQEYQIYQDDVQIATVPAPGNSYSATGLSSNTGYIFRVEAVDTCGNASSNGPQETITTAADVVTHAITVTAGEGGTAQGSASVTQGEAHTVSATANQGYVFVNWTEGGAEASTSASYSFTVTQSRSLHANFAPVASSSSGPGSSSSEIPIDSSVPASSVSSVPSSSPSSVSSSAPSSGPVSKPPVVSNVPVAAVQLNMQSKDMKKGQSITLKAAVSPSNATNKKVTWKSSSTKVASVTQSGRVTAVNEGSTKITATVGGKSASVSIRVNQKWVAVSSIKLQTGALTLAEKGSFALAATISPAKASNKKVVWQSANAAVASVDSKGKVTAKGVGKTSITATSSEGGKVAKLTVTVKPAVTKLTLSSKTISVSKGKNVTLKATVQPSAAAGAAVWSSSKPGVATVTSKGVVKGVAKGTTIITVQAGNKKATCKVTVK